MRQKAAGVLRPLLALAAALAPAVACVPAAPSLSVIHLNTPPRALVARDRGTVTVFSTGAPTRPFVEVALIQSRREWGTLETPQEIFERMRVEAARTGCDGLVLLGEANLVNGLIYPSIGVFGPETHGAIETLEGFRGA